MFSRIRSNEIEERCNNHEKSEATFGIPQVMGGSVNNSIYIQPDDVTALNSSNESNSNLVFLAAAVNTGNNDDSCKSSTIGDNHYVNSFESQHFSIHDPPLIRLSPTSPNGIFRQNVRNEEVQDYASLRNRSFGSGVNWLNQEIYVKADTNAGERMHSEKMPTSSIGKNVVSVEEFSNGGRFIKNNIHNNRNGLKRKRTKSKINRQNGRHSLESFFSTNNRENRLDYVRNTADELEDYSFSKIHENELHDISKASVAKKRLIGNHNRGHNITDMKLDESDVETFSFSVSELSSQNVQDNRDSKLKSNMSPNLNNHHTQSSDINHGHQNSTIFPVLSTYRNLPIPRNRLRLFREGPVNHTDFENHTSYAFTNPRPNHSNNSQCQIRSNIDESVSRQEELFDSSVSNFLRVFGLEEVRQRQLVEATNLGRDQDMQSSYMTFSDRNIYNIGGSMESVIQLALYLETSWRGMNSEELLCLPIHNHKSSIGQNLSTSLQDKCMVCLEEFLENDSLRTLGCSHQYHVVCVDKWLKLNRTCPMCRADALAG